jgi:hypothetical protein
MGGYGSGLQGSKKITVEYSLCLSISSLMRKKALVPGSWTRGSWQWSYEGSEPHATIGYEANLTDPDAAWLRLTYTTSGNPMDYRVRLVTTQPTYGGRRWWFLGPLERQDGGPPRRVAKLYLPPGGRYFGSREAYGLTYTSCQESGKYDGLYRRLAAEMGTDAASIRFALKRASKSDRPSHLLARTSIGQTMCPEGNPAATQRVTDRMSYHSNTP